MRNGITKTFFNGKFGFGQSAVLLKPSADCPATMLYMNEGTPMKKSNIFCIFYWQLYYIYRLGDQAKWLHLFNWSYHLAYFESLISTISLSHKNITDIVFIRGV